MKYSKWYLTTPFYSNITSLCDASIWTLQEESEKDSTLLWKKDSAESPGMVVDLDPIGLIRRPALKGLRQAKKKSAQSQEKPAIVNIDLWVSFIFTPPKFNIVDLKKMMTGRRSGPLKNSLFRGNKLRGMYLFLFLPKSWKWKMGPSKTPRLVFLLIREPSFPVFHWTSKWTTKKPGRSFHQILVVF